MMVLLQVALAEFMPTQVFAVVTVLVLVAVAMSLARLTSTSQTPTSTRSQGAAAQPSKAPQGSGLGLQQLDRWTAWQLVSGVAGLAMVPQVLYNITVPGAASFLPGCLALLIISALVALQVSNMHGTMQHGTHACMLMCSCNEEQAMRSSSSYRAGPPRCCSHCRLCHNWWVAYSNRGMATNCLPACLPQVRNFLEPQSLQGLSVGTMLLALAGNMLMVPRALLVQDRVWLAGTSWACVAGWGQLLSMALRQSPATGNVWLHGVGEGPVLASCSVRGCKLRAGSLCGVGSEQQPSREHRAEHELTVRILRVVLRVAIGYVGGNRAVERHSHSSQGRQPLGGSSCGRSGSVMSRQISLKPCNSRTAAAAAEAALTAAAGGSTQASRAASPQLLHIALQPDPAQQQKQQTQGVSH
ncbi:hypothetical protein QJQ45_020492, partial [Haematococcus lacustris]